METGGGVKCDPRVNVPSSGRSGVEQLTGSLSPEDKTRFAVNGGSFVRVIFRRARPLLPMLILHQRSALLREDGAVSRFFHSGRTHTCLLGDDSGGGTLASEPEATAR